jgi:hypothetical protein
LFCDARPLLVRALVYKTVPHGMCFVGSNARGFVGSSLQFAACTAALLGAGAHATGCTGASPLFSFEQTAITLIVQVLTHIQHADTPPIRLTASVVLQFTIAVIYNYSATCSTAGCWLLAAGCWLLAAGCWLLAAGCWLLLDS